MCTWVGLGRWAWWWKFNRWTLCVQNTFIILIMVEKPTSRPMEFCHICRKGKLYTPCGCVAASMVNTSEIKRKRGFLCFSVLFFYFEIRKDKLPTAGKFNFHACFLRVNLMSSAMFDRLLWLVLSASSSKEHVIWLSQVFAVSSMNLLKLKSSYHIVNWWKFLPVTRLYSPSLTFRSVVIITQGVHKHKTFQRVCMHMSWD